MPVPLSSLAIQPIPEYLEGATVEEMWNVESGWKWEVFASFLDSQTLQQIATYELEVDSEMGDLHYWKGSPQGGFSIKYALKIIRTEDDSTSDIQWDLVWKSPVQQRVRVFLWLTLHDRNLSNVNRFKRNLVDDPKCLRCGGADETTLHMLRDCPAARYIWSCVGKSALYHTFFSGNLTEWIVTNLRSEGLIYSDKWPACFATTLWWIWRWRNCVNFGRSEEIPMDIKSFLTMRFDELQNAREYGLNRLSQIGVREYEEIYIRWKCPSMNWYALNSDGAARGAPGAAGGGGVIRDSRGGFLRGFAAHFGVSNSFRAEMMAVSKGLKMARELGIKALEVQMDNMACVQILNNTDNLGGECAQIFLQCRNLIRCSEWRVRVIHCYREGNRAADWLANHGVMQTEDIIFYEEAPRELAHILREDIIGVALPQIVPLY